MIFIKNPIPGTVKTRLAETIGKDAALEVYHKLVVFTLNVADSVNGQKQIWYSSFIDAEDNFGGRNFQKRLQSGDHLGERMKDAFKQAFGSGYEKVLIIGSDCPDITPKIIDDAYTMLDDSEVVIGPSEDGGYYLLGCRKFFPKLFDNIPWSTPDVLIETLSTLDMMGISYQRLPKLNDIDTEEDLKRSRFL